MAGCNSGIVSMKIQSNHKKCISMTSLQISQSEKIAYLLSTIGREPFYHNKYNSKQKGMLSKCEHTGTAFCVLLLMPRR